MSGSLGKDPNEARRIGRLRPLRWSTAIAWASWTLSLLLLWYHHRARVLHPHFLLLLSLLILTVASAVFGLAYASWSALRGPRRLLVLAWGAGSLFPALLWVFLGLYAIHHLGKGEVPNNLWWKLVSLSSGSVMEAQAVYLYPYRIETEHPVMFYDDRVAHPRRDAEAMERHVTRLEDFLLHHYGAERFLKLYFACRSGTCEADFRLVLGEDFEAVETKFWEGARELAGGRRGRGR
jgi:hypothetical protein